MLYSRAFLKYKLSDMDQQQLQVARQQVLSIFEAGVARVKGFNAVAEYLTHHSLSGEYHLIAVGKAASSMSLGALCLGQLDGTHRLRNDVLDTRLQR